MKDIIKVSNNILSHFIKNEVFISCTTEDDGDGDMEYVSDDLTVCDDTERNQYTVCFQLMENTSSLEHSKTLTELLGAPTHPQGHPDVNNWKVGKVLIVHRDQRLELFRDYRKV